MVWAFIFNDKLVKTFEIFPYPNTECLPNYRKRKKKKKHHCFHSDDEVIVPHHWKTKQQKQKEREIYPFLVSNNLGKKKQ